ncbi:L-seryl-tRNA(Sec) selenium transferase [Campylobacter pinnipediorum]|uniref:L-seryl-tRNA(Sec) selenium transferase n=1 Tax=Campylobacter pinnipediorum TaxID=1965231 RepID=UPI00084DCE3C|nr:L-seryl-tRNA(Sec) selenium transferase [Campylobacter pinnipediorum]AQW83378.1 selenocysteine synthase [Campylobacter pinnipediorum subsp. pinnipediorum]
MDFKDLLQVDKILNLEEFKLYSKPLLAKISRAVLDEQRKLIIQKKPSLSKDEIINEISQRYAEFQRFSFQKVINATGVVMHTNLGRSIIDEEILKRAKDVICAYSNLEFDLQSGSRGNRYDYVSNLCKVLFDCEDALVVNNNASAVFLILNTFAKNKEVVVSRGELVEIGGSFRIPDVMLNSGAILKEVGTTNKTNIDDYKNAITQDTNMLFKAHKSNFDIVGFAQSVAMKDISNIAKKNGLIDYYDLGSGYVNELGYNLSKDEPSISRLLQDGVSLVSFSGDKLFGSVQSGIILGKKELISKLRKNQLLRMLRVDKVVLSILCESIKAYINKELNLITTINLINKKENDLFDLANLINSKLSKPLKILKTTTFVGGGSLPNKNIPSVALAISGNAIKNEQKYREKNVIGRIENNSFIFDLRSILYKDVDDLIKIINELENE